MVMLTLFKSELESAKSCNVFSDAKKVVDRT